MKTMCSIAGILLLAGCASSRVVAVERPPSAARIIEHSPAAPRITQHPPTLPPAIDSAYEGPRNPERVNPAQRRIDKASDRARDVVVHARRQIGIRYRYGGSSPQRGFDCSGLVRYAYRQAGVVMPRTTEAMSEIGFALRKSELKPGDLVFFDTRHKPFSHVGIYVGGHRFIHAPASGGAVQLVDMRERYWRVRYVGARQ
jgi:cell wall-associated NlpC family hydrolase